MPSRGVGPSTTVEARRSPRLSSASPTSSKASTPSASSVAQAAKKKAVSEKGKGKGKEGDKWKKGKKDKKPSATKVPRWRTAPSKVESQALPPFTRMSEDRIHLPRSTSELAAARAVLLSAPLLGFDTETKPIFRKGVKDDGPHLVQLATTSDAYLLQIHLNPDALQLARDVMSDPAILKVGFGLDGDIKTLPRKIGANLANVHDLDHDFQRMGFGKTMGVRAAIAVVCGQDFRKPKTVTMSNWKLPVYTPQQVAYAANDAYTAALLYELIPDWEARQEPREYWEAKIKEEEERKAAEAAAKAEADAAAGIVPTVENGGRAALEVLVKNSKQRRAEARRAATQNYRDLERTSLRSRIERTPSPNECVSLGAHSIGPPRQRGSVGERSNLSNSHRRVPPARNHTSEGAGPSSHHYSATHTFASSQNYTSQHGSYSSSQMAQSHIAVQVSPNTAPQYMLPSVQRAGHHHMDAMAQQMAAQQFMAQEYGVPAFVSPMFDEAIYGQVVSEDMPPQQAAGRGRGQARRGRGGRGARGGGVVDRRRH